jgi:hypothetical protein
MFHFPLSLRVAVSWVETAHPSPLHVSMMWFSCKLGPLMGISACSHRAQWTSTRFQAHSIAYWRISRSGIVLFFFVFWILKSAQRNPYERPRLITQESIEQSNRLPAEGRAGNSENTSKLQRCFCVTCLALFAYMPLVVVRRLVTWPCSNRKHKRAAAVSLLF